MKKKILPLVEWLVNEETEDSGVFAVSVVDNPAIEEDFMYFSKDKIINFENDKQILVGPSLIPNKKIYRNDSNGGYEGYFSRETIEKIQMNFFKKQKNLNITFQHEDVDVSGFIFESWVKTDKDNDKSNAYGFNLPVGTWFISMKIDDNKVWKFIKDGKIRGFSIEALLMENILRLKYDEIDEQIFEKLEELEDILKKKVNLVKTKDIDGNNIIYDKLKEGEKIYIETKNGQEPLQNGGHELKNGIKIRVKDGKITQIGGDIKTKVNRYKIWRTNSSAVGPCDFCKGLDGKIVEYHQTWSHQGYTGLTPGKVHKGCNCYFEYIEK